MRTAIYGIICGFAGLAFGIYGERGVEILVNNPAIAGAIFGFSIMIAGFIVQSSVVTGALLARRSL